MITAEQVKKAGINDPEFYHAPLTSMVAMKIILLIKVVALVMN
jgi:hypothetical protein